MERKEKEGEGTERSIEALKRGEGQAREGKGGIENGRERWRKGRRGMGRKTGALKKDEGKAIEGKGGTD